MAITRHKFSVIFFSWAAGVMYSTMFTMPYLLIAHYHSTNTVSIRLYRVQTWHVLGASLIFDIAFFFQVCRKCLWSRIGWSNQRFGHRCSRGQFHGIRGSVHSVHVYGDHRQHIRDDFGRRLHCIIFSVLCFGSRFANRVFRLIKPRTSESHENMLIFSIFLTRYILCIINNKYNHIIILSTK